ncbi:hypothetical protein DSCA_62960 [Desulfosarcina alkanivorans]|jgi:PAS domain S-box-containing protein|uniref:histidine kinase n=1 Tax=Desulfosarcina alkanivorans TaxID=571177 RepID=A0A5K7YSP8_9BACT|nr:PAS domain S-box protein [Desulfosarcina alkanivorans]BBO72366.1 hypothetical protein DSCA_62960 [Desulfosarcina alkanivorans]
MKTKQSYYEKFVEKVQDLRQERRKRKVAEKALLKSQKRYERLVSTIPCALYDYVRWPDGRTRFLYISSHCMDIFEHDADSIIGNPGLLWGMVHPEDAQRLNREDLEANQARTRFHSEVRLILPSGKIKWIELTSMPSGQEFESQTIWSGVILDITERKEAEEERNQLVVELQSALLEVKTLSGFLPICASCKKIRDDKGYWNQIEAYIESRSEAEFSHGICPDCAQQLYPELELTAK